MDKAIKDFDRWNERKKKVNYNAKNILPKIREVWWLSNLQNKQSRVFGNQKGIKKSSWFKLGEKKTKAPQAGHSRPFDQVKHLCFNNSRFKNVVKSGSF